jgi:hypothetical protein
MNCVGTYYLSGSGHLFKSLNFLGSYSNISGFYIVADLGHPIIRRLRGLNGLYIYFPHRFPMIKFRLADNLLLDYSDFRDEGLRVGCFRAEWWR